MSRQSRSLRRVFLAALLTVASVVGVPGLGFVGTAHALTTTVDYYPFCDVNLLEVSTAQDEPTQGLIALSLGGAPATSEDCLNSSYGTGVAFTTGGSAASSVAAFEVNGCSTIADYASGVGASTTSTCSPGYLANVSVFGDADGSGWSSYGDPLLSFSLMGDASGSWIAVAPLGTASSPSGVAVGCQATATGVTWWKWCAALDLVLTPSQRDLVYSTLQTLAGVGLVETQAAINFYNSSLSGIQTEIETSFKPTEPCNEERDGDTIPTGIMPNLDWECGLRGGVWDWRLVYTITP